MADRTTAKLLAAAFLCATSTWAVVAFVAPSPAGRGELAPAPTRSEAKEYSSTISGFLAPLGLAAVAFAVGRPQTRSTATTRKFFGDSSPPPAKATSYKDFNDPFLRSADFGFDPLNLAIQGGTFDSAASAVPETEYYNYRESEVKHGRFAMGAFLAIFAEEADRGALLKQLGVAGAQDNLDGTLGLDEVQLPVLAIGIGIQALAEYNLQQGEDDGNFLSVEYDRNRMPGDLGFDPLNFQGSNDKIDLHNTEINLGRLAMIGVTSYLFREFVAKDL
jgi:hypothetical protein